jgi:ferredoxin, 2Fe-2S
MKVRFIPQNIELEITSEQSVKNLADNNHVFIKSLCNGLPSCAECRVKVVEGEHNVLPPSSKELNLIGTGYFIDQRRLSCQLHCFGDVTIDLSEQIEKEKSATARKPQGSRKADIENTHAVTGNLIEQETNLFVEVENPSGGQQRHPNKKRR